MNLFLLGWSASGGTDAGRTEEVLRSLVRRLPFFTSDGVRRWRAGSGRVALACVSHEPDRVGGVRYLHLEPDRFALFSGRPFQWTGDTEADGRAPLDPRFYLRSSKAWRDDLDGRCVAVRYDDAEGELEVFTDPLGAYPVYSGGLDGVQWISNSAEAVREAVGARELDFSVVACLLGAGWSFRGHSAWAGVRRLPRGAVHTLRPGRPDARIDLLPLEKIAALPGAGFDADRAARTLVAAVRAVGDWPGRPNLLQLTGGRDSRLVFAAALAGGRDFQALTAGSPRRSDVLVARRLCEIAGVSHRRLPYDPGRALRAHTRETARIVSLTSGAATSLEDAAGHPLRERDGVLPLWLNGQGGEVSRVYYGNADGGGRDGLVRWLLRTVAPTSNLLAPRGRELLEREAGSLVDEALDAGVPRPEVPDVFYLLSRMGSWAALGHGCAEYGKGDTVAPLWTRRVLDHQLGAPRAQREKDGFPLTMLRELAPQFAEVPFDRGRRQPLNSRDFVPVHRQVGEAVSSQLSHEAWELLDRDYVQRLLARDALSFDRYDQRAVWRLGTVFMARQPEGT